MKTNIWMRSFSLIKYSAFFFLVAGGCPAIHAADYLGANAVLQQVATRIAKPEDKKPADPQSQLREELKTFSQSATNLPPADAAGQWLALVERAGKLQAIRNDNPLSQPITPDEVLAALPPPAAWGELAAAIAARPPAKNGNEINEIGLHLLAATLTANPVARDQAITNLQAKAQSASNGSAYLYRSILDQISQALIAGSNDPDAVLKALEAQLSIIGRGRNEQDLAVPNLVPQIGTEKAEAFLRKALVTPNVILAFSAANDTSRLAQKLALELLPQLKTPQWGLVNSLGAVELYEALDKRFSAPTNNPPPATGLGGIISGIIGGSTDDNNEADDQRKNPARIYYLLGLIGQNRSKEAVVIAKKLAGTQSYYFSEAFQSMEHAGYTAELDNFFYDLLAQNPALPFWDQYVELAANAGTTERMVTLVRKTIAGADLNEGKKAALHQILFKALLAADNTGEAVVEMRELITNNTPGPASSFEAYNNGQLGALLARLGSLLHKPEWTSEGIDTARKWLATPAGQNVQNNEAGTVLNSIVHTLFELQRGPEAEALLLDALANASRGNNSPNDYYNWNDPPTRKVLTELITLYSLAGRNQDVLQLLQQSPDWSVGDLSGLLNSTSWDDTVSVMWLHTGSSPLPVPYLAAKALLASGQKEPARKITEALLTQYPGLDRGYELLLALDDTNAIPELDQLFARDQFEERPLIWKAHLLRQSGQLEAAEKIIRQAIAIDPSDGEEGRGDRMRAYAELAEILDARGNRKDADEYREVIKAIRLSEDADQFYAAGLLKHAVGMYKEGLSHFSDAYCIQSRLAIQLSALGMNAEAEEHYRRAYELMPDSFGRVESHCFGCEKAFAGEHAQSIAEKVFTQLVIDRPDKPQVHYLLGYLRFEQDRFNEARTNFLAATKLDPDYLNAWVNAQAASDETLVPAKARDEITFNILRLDPLNRHACIDFRRVSDLAGLWQAVATAASYQPTVSTNLYPLPASQAALEKKLASNSANPSLRWQMQEQFESAGRTTTPAKAIAQTPFVQLAGTMLLNNEEQADTSY